MPPGARASAVGRRRERRLGFGAAIGLAFLLCLLSLNRAFAAGPDCEPAAEQRATVSSIGDRLELALADGRRVRLAGLDAPDSGRGDSATAAAALAFATSWLSGREVGMRILSAKPDRWGRTLVDISAPPPAGAEGAEPVSVSLLLLGAGFARVWPEPEIASCLVQHLQAEAQARDKQLGLWRDPYYGVIEAADLDNLRKRDGQFTLVEGTPSRVGEGRSRFYVDFGLHRGFTIVIPKRRAKAFERAGITISALSGAKIRVRGALDNRFGLRMEVLEPDAIERLDAVDRAKGDAQTP